MGNTDFIKSKSSYASSDHVQRINQIESSSGRASYHKETVEKLKRCAEI